MSKIQCVLWRGDHFDGKRGAWTACLGYRPVSPYGGNEYIEMMAVSVHEKKVAELEERIVDLLEEIQDTSARAYEEGLMDGANQWCQSMNFYVRFTLGYIS